MKILKYLIILNFIFASYGCIKESINVSKDELVLIIDNNKRGVVLEDGNHSISKNSKKITFKRENEYVFDQFEIMDDLGEIYVFGIKLNYKLNAKNIEEIYNTINSPHEILSYEGILIIIPVRQAIRTSSRKLRLSNYNSPEKELYDYLDNFIREVLKEYVEFYEFDLSITKRKF